MRERSSENTRAGSFPTHQSCCGTLGTARRKKEGLSSDQALRIRAVERGFLTNGAKTDIDEDWEHGRVWFKKLRTEGRAITIYGRWCIQEN